MIAHAEVKHLHRPRTQRNRSITAQAQSYIRPKNKSQTLGECNKGTYWAQIKKGWAQPTLYLQMRCA